MAATTSNPSRYNPLTHPKENAVRRKIVLEKMYEEGVFRALTFDEYADILCDCLKELPPDMVVHRFTGDGPKNILVAPLWSADKKRVINDLNRIISKL